jgi:hypothetical protein
MCPTEAFTSNPLPRYFSIVFALAGDSTITNDFVVAIPYPIPSLTQFALYLLTACPFYHLLAHLRHVPMFDSLTGIPFQRRNLVNQLAGPMRLLTGAG